MSCYICGKSLCEWLEYGIIALDTIENRFNCVAPKSDGYVLEMGSERKVMNNNIRLYCMFTYENYGCLVKGNLMKIPNCVESLIKELLPVDGIYTNFFGDIENDSIR
jgi:hypothetical protein